MTLERSAAWLEGRPPAPGGAEIADGTAISPAQQPRAWAGSRRIAARTGERVEAIDIVRGAVMVLMVLDHCRDFLHASSFDPRLVSQPALFLTRWVTHFCAPTFVFLAGVSAYLYGQRAQSIPALQRFLWTRGAWLVLLELSVVRIGWSFDAVPRLVLLQVIWALGVSMLALGVLVRLPRWAVAGFAVLLVCGHNALDGVAPETPAGAWLWALLHGTVQLTTVGGSSVWLIYPLIPWLGVMAAGYALGPVLEFEPLRRRRVLVTLGGALCAGFVLLRAANGYGNPTPWTAGGNALETLLSFLNCEKYPPSLTFLAMTLGPMLIVLGLLANTRVRLPATGWLATIGSVPLFYYVAHIYVLHVLAVLLSLATTGSAAGLFGGFPPPKPPGYGLSLPAVYATTLLVVAALALASRWYAALKRRRREWWWSYL